jgi:hypothetical protein
MRPKGKLFALFAVFAAIGLVTASGAFTTVQADRTAEVNVAGDAGALVAIEPHTSNNGDAYAENESGQVELSLIGEFDNDQDPAGINQDALTNVNFVINITNQGSQTANVSIERTGTNAGVLGFVNGTADSGTNMTAPAGNSNTIGPGETIEVSITIDTRDSSLGTGAEILNEVTIVAEAT